MRAPARGRVMTRIELASTMSSYSRPELNTQEAGQKANTMTRAPTKTKKVTSTREAGAMAIGRTMESSGGATALT